MPPLLPSLPRFILGFACLRIFPILASLLGPFLPWHKTPPVFETSCCRLDQDMRRECFDDLSPHSWDLSDEIKSEPKSFFPFSSLLLPTRWTYVFSLQLEGQTLDSFLIPRSLFFGPPIVCGFFFEEDTPAPLENCDSPLIDGEAL